MYEHLSPVSQAHILGSVPQEMIKVLFQSLSMHTVASLKSLQSYFVNHILPKHTCLFLDNDACPIMKRLFLFSLQGLPSFSASETMDSFGWVLGYL